MRFRSSNRITRIIQTGNLMFFISLPTGKLTFAWISAFLMTVKIQPHRRETVYSSSFQVNRYFIVIIIIVLEFDCIHCQGAPFRTRYNESKYWKKRHYSYSRSFVAAWNIRFLRQTMGTCIYFITNRRKYDLPGGWGWKHGQSLSARETLRNNVSTGEIG